MKILINDKNNNRIEAHHNTQEVSRDKKERSLNTLNLNNADTVRRHEFIDRTFQWVKTPLSAFGFKCIMNKHELCTDVKCQCVCHDHN